MKQELSMMILKDYDDFSGKIETFWNHLTHDYLTLLINSMQDRLDQCINSDGYETEY